MGQDKYYTPSIEEFHVGFEYEIYEPDYGGPRELEYAWIKQEFKSYTFDSEIETIDGEMPFEAGIEEKKIRVKYLDKADIEELGFVCKGTRNYNKRNDVEESGWTKLFEDGSYCDIKCFLDEDNKVNSCLYITSTDIFCSDTHSPWDGYCEGGSGPGCWQINIKNKSELKMLLKQLGVDE